MRRFILAIVAILGWLSVAAATAALVPVEYQGALGVFGTVASVLGLLYAIIQIVGTRSAAESARAAAAKTAMKLRRDRIAHALSRILEMLREIDKFALRNSWDDASTRSEALATQITDLLCILPVSDEIWTALARSARDWSKGFADAAAGREMNIMSWRAVRDRIHDKAAKELQLANQDDDDE
jgi:aminoglycoside phosphotransferase (APT) family kinase protein